MFKGVIIEESLEDKTVLQRFPILKAEVEQVMERFGTPWLSQWTLHTIDIPDEQIALFAGEVQKALDGTHHNWYADFKNEKTHYIIFKQRVFVIDRTKYAEYQEAQEYGASLGIPSHQVAFTKNVV